MLSIRESGVQDVSATHKVGIMIQLFSSAEQSDFFHVSDSGEKYLPPIVTQKRFLHFHPTYCLYAVSNFDPRFVNSRYMMTDLGKTRLKGYLRTFTYMSVCGALFILGGGVFFIHESLTMEGNRQNDKASNGGLSKVSGKLSEKTF